MQRVKIRFAASACAMAAIAAVPARAQQTLTVHDPRPVAAMILELEKTYSWQITYEDPPYAYAADIEDLTAGVERYPGKERILVPKARTLSVVGLAPQENAAIENVLAGYSRLTGVQAFRLVKNGTVYHVIPNHARDASGSLRRYASILDTKIAVRPGQRTAYRLIEEICQKVSQASGKTVALGMAPHSMLMSLNTTVGTAGRKETAEAVLDQFVAESGTRLSWRLLYDPGLRFYALNLHFVPEKQR